MPAEQTPSNQLPSDFLRQAADIWDDLNGGRIHFELLREAIQQELQEAEDPRAQAWCAHRLGIVEGYLEGIEDMQREVLGEVVRGVTF